MTGLVRLDHQLMLAQVPYCGDTRGETVVGDFGYSGVAAPLRDLPTSL